MRHRYSITSLHCHNPESNDNGSWKTSTIREGEGLNHTIMLRKKKKKKKFV